MNKNPLIYLGVFLLLILCVHADYGIYGMMGGTDLSNSTGASTGLGMRYSAFFQRPSTDAYTAVQIPGSMSSFIEPIAFDSNNDQKPELFMDSGGAIGVFSGQNPSVVLGNFGGQQLITPVACDVDGDTRQDYVGIINASNNTYELVAANYDNAGHFNIFSSLNVTLPNKYGNLACGKFYLPLGDTQNYVMWVADDKELNIWTANGASFSGTNISVLDSKAQEAALPYARGSHRIIFSPTIDPAGQATIIFTAGTRAYMYQSDDTRDYEDIQPPGGIGGYNQSSANVGSVELYGPIQAGGERVIVHWDNDAGTGTVDQPASFYHLLRLQFGTINKLASGSSFSIPLNSPFAVPDSINSPSAFGKYDAGVAGDDSLFVRMWDSDPVNAHVIPTAATASGRFVRASASAGTIFTSATQSIAPVNAGDTKATGIIMVDMDKDGLLDEVVARGFAASPTVWEIGYYSGSSNYNSANFTHIINITTTGSNAIFQLPMQAVDLNGDGSPDFIVSPLSDDEAFAIMSNGLFAGSHNTPLCFNVSLPDVGDNQTFEKIKSCENLPSYEYALACNIITEDLWNEHFTTGYNATQRNVTIGMPDGSYTLNAQGLTFTNTFAGNNSLFDVVKHNDFQSFENYRVSVSYSSADDNVAQILVLRGPELALSDYYLIDKVGSSLTVHQVEGSNITFVGNITSGSLVNLELVYRPFYDGMGNAWFNTTVIINNQTVGKTDNRYYHSLGLGALEFFDGTVNATISLQNIRITKIGNVFPDYLHFTNGINVSAGGLQVTTGAGITEQGDGFTVTTGYNDEFFATCSYASAGTYTQRHYLNRPNDVLDYLNFRDVTVTTVGAPVTPPLTGENQQTTSTLVQSFIDLLGLHNIVSIAAFEFFTWLLLCVFLAFLGFRAHWVLGVLVFISFLTLGVVIAWVPLWVGLVLVIIAAGLVAVAFRNQFAG